jgi:hypothetical protein
MHDTDGNAAAAPDPYDNADGVTADAGESLRVETRAAVNAVAEHIRKVATTAATEAELSVASVAAIAAAAVVSLLLVVTAWLCLIAALVWLAVQNGLPVVTALLIAAAANVVAVLGLLLWSKSLLRNVGFARTRQLVFPESQ